MGTKNELFGGPGKAVIRFKAWYAGFDFGYYVECNKGDTIEVDVDAAARVSEMYGSSSPFEIVSENKAMGGSDEEKAGKKK